MPAFLKGLMYSVGSQIDVSAAHFCLGPSLTDPHKIPDVQMH